MTDHHRREERICPTCGRTFMGVVAKGQRFCRPQCVRYRDATARFWAKVDATGGLFACWPWQGSRQGGTGYGHLTVERESVLAHRMALELALGRSLEPGEHALHSCDNPPCCNPGHLRVGTHAENMADMVARGRHGSHRVQAAA